MKATVTQTAGQPTAMTPCSLKRLLTLQHDPSGHELGTLIGCLRCLRRTRPSTSTRLHEKAHPIGRDEQGSNLTWGERREVVAE